MKYYLLLFTISILCFSCTDTGTPAGQKTTEETRPLDETQVDSIPNIEGADNDRMETSGDTLNPPQVKTDK